MLKNKIRLLMGILYKGINKFVDPFSFSRLITLGTVLSVSFHVLLKKRTDGFE